MTPKVSHQVSLRIWHPTLIPERISQELDLPTHANWTKGDARKSITGAAIGPHTTNYWTSRLYLKSSGSLHESLKDFCLMLEPHADFLRQVSATGGRAEFFVGFFTATHAGDVLPHTLLRMMANLGIDLALDVYAEPSSAADTTEPSA